MNKQIKKITSAILIFCLSVTGMCAITASAVTPKIIAPLYNNTSSASSNINISNSGQLKIYYDYTGLSGKTTKVVITTYIEKKTLGLFWSRVENGQPNNQWVDTSYTLDYYKLRTFQLSSTGTYRVTVTYKVYGSGGAADEIKCVMKDSY